MTASKAILVVQIQSTNFQELGEDLAKPTGNNGKQNIPSLCRVSTYLAKVF